MLDVPAQAACRDRLRLHKGQNGGLYFHHYDGKDWPFHCHDEFEFNLVLRGMARYETARLTYELSPGALIWLHPEQPHRLVRQSRDFRMWVVVIRPRALRSCLAGGDALARRRLLASDPPEHACRLIGAAALAELDHLLRLLARQHSQPAAFNPGLGFALHAAWQAWSTASGPAGAAGLHPAVAEASRIISAQPALALGGIDRRVGLSRSRLSRLFSAQLGETLLAFRERQRLEGCRRRLDDGATALAAALEAGFGSYAQFHRAFTRAHGQGPRRWLADRPAGHWH